VSVLNMYRFFLCHHANTIVYEHSSYIVLGIVSKLEMI
jgi:hypothetical protein